MTIMAATPDIDAVRALEKRLAVAASWGVFASFGVAFVLCGFSAAQWGPGLLGYALLVAGFVSHVTVNRAFHIGFSGGEIALGLVLFGISALSFIGSWLFDPHFGRVNLGLGLAGFAALTICAVGYLIVAYGLRGSYELIHSLRGRSERAA